jgi:SAM-dependent methyltransferase
MGHETEAVNPFDDPALVRRYEEWYAGKGRHADVLEKKLLGKLLQLFPKAHSVLEVGCGTGHFTRWMSERGLGTAGLDISESMLNEARRLGEPTRYFLGDALALPVADRSFDLTALITTLEFLPDPARALSEAIRVARQGVLLGVLNRWSLVTLRYRLSGKPMWRSARFFGPWELARLAKRASGGRAAAIAWQTTLWPIPGVRDLPLPWGGFIGMAVQLREKRKHEYDFGSGKPLSSPATAPGARDFQSVGSFS